MKRLGDAILTEAKISLESGRLSKERCRRTRPTEEHTARNSCWFISQLGYDTKKKMQQGTHTVMEEKILPVYFDISLMVGWPSLPKNKHK